MRLFSCRLEALKHAAFAERPGNFETTPVTTMATQMHTILYHALWADRRQAFGDPEAVRDDQRIWLRQLLRAYA